MKIKVKNADLKRAAGNAHAIASKATFSQILTHVRFETDDEMVTLSTVNATTSLRENIPASVERQGQTTVSAAHLNDVVRRLPESNNILIEYSAEDQRLHVFSGSATVKLKTLLPEDFPAIRDEEVPVAFAMPAKEIRDALNKAKIAALADDQRSYASGVYFHRVGESANEQLGMASLNGVQLAQVLRGIAPFESAWEPVLLPLRSINELVGALPDDSTPVDFGIATNEVTVRTPGAYLSVRPINTAFPRYTNFIVDDNNIRVTVDSAMMRKALDLVGAVTEKNSRTIVLQLSDGRMVLSAFGYNTGSGEEVVPIVYEERNDEGSWTDCETENTLRFNYENLKSVLMLSEGGKLGLHFNAGRQVMFIHDDDEQARYVMMPQ